MFLGHYAAALAAKGVAPETSLGATFVACQWADLVFPALTVAGVERMRIDHDATAVMPLDLEHMPWSHSLLMSVVWTGAAFGLFKLLKRETRDAVVIAAVVFSHWVLDLIAHRPDLPLAFGDSPRVGLGLWHSVPGTLAVEGAMWIGAVVIYARSTRPRSARGRWSLWSLIALLSLVYVGLYFAPPPPEGPTTSLVGLAGLGFVLLAWWAHQADRHREPIRSRLTRDS